MTDRSLSELANGEIVPDQGGPNAWLARFGEGDYDMVNKSGKNTLLLKNDVDVSDTVSYGGIMVDFNLDRDVITLHDGDNGVRVPDDKHEHVLWAVHDEDGDRLNDLFDELYEPTVRKGLMNQFMPRFRRSDDEIEKTSDGWLVDGDVMVTWAGENYVATLDRTHTVSGGNVVEVDETKPAREISWPDVGNDLHATAPDGRTFDLDEVEARFLATVGVLLDRNPSNYDDSVRELIEGASVRAFTDEKSGLYHGHGIDKHTLDMLGVTDEAASRLWYNDYDHAGVWELAVREEEFRNAPVDVFEDAPDDSDEKWDKIHSTREQALIPQQIRDDLEARYE